jgi:tRNA U54 and U55 pseudouridine synthase Pus10
MLNKIKRLEELVNNSVALIKKLEEENAVLKQQVQALTADRQRIIKNSAGARELERFKDKVRRKLSRITAGIDKAITLQDTLFGEDPDDDQ